jgi:hypothetical protein
MGTEKPRVSRRWRTAALLALGAVVGTMLVAQPAGAHFLPSIKHIWHHIKPKTDALYQTRVAGAASTADIDNFTSATFTPILSKSIAAPRGGFLMIVGSVGAEDDFSLAGTSSLLLRLRVDGTAVTSDQFAFELDADAGTGVTGGTASLNAVVPVSRGTHTVYIEGQEFGSGSYIFGRTLSIAFFPKGSGIGIPVPARPAGAARNLNQG